MSSQQTTGHRKKDMSSSYVDLPGRETDTENSKQGLAGPVVCSVPDLGTAPCMWKWSGQGTEFPLAAQSCCHGKKLRAMQQVGGRGRAGGRRHLDICSKVT